MGLSDKIYEITFKRRDGGADEIQQYTGRREAKAVLKMFNDPVSRELYLQVILSEYDPRQKTRRIVEALDFQGRDRERDWRKWSVGRYTKYEYHEFDGSGVLYGLITQMTDDHAIMEADGLALWIDDDTACMFS